MPGLMSPAKPNKLSLSPNGRPRKDQHQSIANGSPPAHYRNGKLQTTNQSSKAPLGKPVPSPSPRKPNPHNSRRSSIIGSRRLFSASEPNPIWTTGAINGSDILGFSGSDNSENTPANVLSSSENRLSGIGAGRTKDKESVTVTVRFRPLNNREIQRGDDIVWFPDGDNIVRSQLHPTAAYAFDRVFGPSTITSNVYDAAARHVVHGAMDGINGTVFAYGVTSSGKTHTMHGDQKSPGIIPLAIKDVFSIIQETPSREYLLRVSYLEIYNEVINDLLDPAGQNLRVREDVQGTYVEGIKEELVLSPAHCLSLIATGEEHRHVGSNNFNLVSSRSHTIFTLTIESSTRGNFCFEDDVTLSQLNLIDLAGSESSKTETTGLRRKEGAYINKSLLTLGTVISKLTDGKAIHIPYRDSKLTRLLQPSLSGHGRISLICTITPASSSNEETHNTVKFAHRAKHIQIRALQNKIMDEKSLIKKYQSEIQNLKNELDDLKSRIPSNSVVMSSQEDLVTLKQQLEAGQEKLQSRLEEEEQAKTALLVRIQRLTKLILVSNKNANPQGHASKQNHRRRHSFGEHELAYLPHKKRDFAFVERKSDDPEGFKDVKSAGSNVEGGEKPAKALGRMNSKTMAGMENQLELLRDQVKMLSNEVSQSITFLKRLPSYSGSNLKHDQLDNMKNELQEKKKKMHYLEQRVIQCGQSGPLSSTILELSQMISKVMNDVNERVVELEIKSLDIKNLQEQLQKKETKIEDLQKDQERLLNENSNLEARNYELTKDASYANQVATAAALELKNLAEEMETLSKRNTSLATQLSVAEDIGQNAFRHTPPGITESNDGLKQELLESRQREAALEEILVQRDLNEAEILERLEDAKKGQTDLENDLAGMWALIRKLKHETMTSVELQSLQESTHIEIGTENFEDIMDLKMLEDCLHEEMHHNAKLETLVSQLRIEDLEDLDAATLEDLSVLHLDALTKLCHAKDKLRTKLGENESQLMTKPTSDLRDGQFCKSCFCQPISVVLFPCLHFSLCKLCSSACRECPLCRSLIQDKIITSPSS
uniref:Kinesin 7-Ia protein n=1 Tax=Marsilea vestita TaxID=59764 RepID=A0A142KW98_MARVE|nr:kinesin 7-Ia protein [Marsilea vestita]